MLFRYLSFAPALLATVQAETILGVTVFTRHGDRTSKHYKGYNLTNLGIQQNYNVGADYRDLYISANSSKQILGISENKAVNSQLFASAPDQAVLLNTATAFLQGLYPPLQSLDSGLAVQSLNNGDEVTAPLEGYQYLVLHSENDDSPDTIWLKGDEECPVLTTSMKNYKNSEAIKQKSEETKSFYQGFWDDLKNVYDMKESNMTYENAYTIFDLINVGIIHNTSMKDAVTPEQLTQLRTLADAYEFGLSYDQNDKARSIGAQAFAGGILAQLKSIVSSQGKLKFSLLAGSYDTFQGFFGLANLTSVSPDFFGLPDYASTMSFEIFTAQNVSAFPSNTEDLRVRFLFRNGSTAGEEPRAFPLFNGKEESLSYSEFVGKMEDIAITKPEQWCSTCGSDLLFCEAYAKQGQSPVSTENHQGGGMSNAVAGVIGAMVTLGVVALVSAAAFFVLRKRRVNAHFAQSEQMRQKSTGSDGVSV
ncbi:phosphoglycerate mutase-like protein [Curvularia clavata]|uniref:Phosphoglycerate mutase-like protein n=1 Tax=Curvularia clavata TaxID=95742 RepID=A0A9Q8ZCB5_CURCL|nr:phosphoglycerate mutase-like protein [Curvularia clavata]